MTIETDRLILRRWSPADRAAFAELHADPEVTKWLGFGPLTREQSDAYVDRHEKHFSEEGFGIWAIERRSDHAFIGAAGLRRWQQPGHPMTPCVEIAWRQARWAWGNGYVAEAATAALRDGFERLHLSEIRSWTAAANIRSQGVMRRIGLQPKPSLDFEAEALPVGHALRPHVAYVARRDCPIA